jgi:hypothetical protein
MCFAPVFGHVIIPFYFVFFYIYFYSPFTFLRIFHPFPHFNQKGPGRCICVRGPVELDPPSPDLNPLGCTLWLHEVAMLKCQNLHLLTHQQRTAACHYAGHTSGGETIGRGELERMWLG